MGGLGLGDVPLSAHDRSQLTLEGLLVQGWGGGGDYFIIHHFSGFSQGNFGL